MILEMIIERLFWTYSAHVKIRHGDKVGTSSESGNLGLSEGSNPKEQNTNCCGTRHFSETKRTSIAISFRQTPKINMKMLVYVYERGKGLFLK